jgi:hypothetical protein
MGKVHAFQESLFCGQLVLITKCQFCPVLMERKTWSVHFVMEDSEKSAQSPEKGVEKQPKKRSQADKVGKLKYLLQRDKKIERDIAEINLKLGILLEGLESSLHFDQPRIERWCCEDEIDREILQALYEAGSPGLLPKDAAAKLARFKVTRHHVRRRLLRMNRRLQKKIKKSVAEQRGWHWALTRFALDAYGATEEDGGFSFG